MAGSDPGRQQGCRLPFHGDFQHIDRLTGSGNRKPPGPPHIFCERTGQYCASVYQVLTVPQEKQNRSVRQRPDQSSAPELLEWMPALVRKELMQLTESASHSSSVPEQQTSIRPLHLSNTPLQKNHIVSIAPVPVISSSPPLHSTQTGSSPVSPAAGRSFCQPPHRILSRQHSSRFRKNPNGTVPDPHLPGPA